MTVPDAPIQCETPAPNPDIYLVDDDPLVRRSLTRLLESAGHTVQSFAEPKRFLQRFLERPASVVVLDIWLEHMTGMEMLAHIYARSPQTRIIFIIGHQDHTAETIVQQTGAFAFLNKPVESELLLHSVRSALGPPPPLVP